MRLVLLIALGWLGLSAPGCISLFDFLPAGTMESPPFPEVDRSRLWQEVKQVINRHWRLKVIDEEDYYVESEWEEHLGPMYKSGFRRQARAWVYDGERGPYFEVQVNTEVNINIKQPLASADADWEDNGRDNQREKAVIYEVEVRVRPTKEPTGTTPDPDAQRYRLDEGSTESEAERRRRLWGR